MQSSHNMASPTIEDADTLIEEIPSDDSLNIEIIEEDQSDFQTQEEADAKFDNEQNEKENSRFKEGETITMIRVRFPGNARSFPFLIGKRRFAYGQKVVAMSDRGMSVGYNQCCLSGLLPRSQALKIFRHKLNSETLRKKQKLFVLT